ncbi:hypothetical protein SAMN04489842_2578 [Natronobacterium texcoconense]|uniref:Uncharacterized protein n=1 Tax=Natronobacterium texcoconense TaxID=1095778 RepID=A0A1H1GS28_NATTX|nr:hypothetical protein SAMN04489842_2578 [Natronobacterium texcoconense]
MTKRTRKTAIVWRQAPRRLPTVAAVRLVAPGNFFQKEDHNVFATDGNLVYIGNNMA